MNARQLSALALLSTVATLPNTAAARDLDITKDRDSQITVWHTLLGSRYGDPAYNGTLPAGHRLQIPGGNHWWTDFSIQQDYLAAAAPRRTTTGLAVVTGSPGAYAMVDLAQAVSTLAPLAGGRIAMPDLQSSFFDVFITIDLDDFVQMGGSQISWAPGMQLTFQNGVCNQNQAIHAAMAAYNFSPQTGWTSPQPYTGPLTVFGQIGLTPKSCYANCDGSTTPPVLNVLDFACFLNRYASGDPEANCDGSTTPPTLNVLDFASFLNEYANGFH